MMTTNNNNAPAQGLTPHDKPSLIILTSVMMFIITSILIFLSKEKYTTISHLSRSSFRDITPSSTVITFETTARNLKKQRKSLPQDNHDDTAQQQRSIHTPSDMWKNPSSNDDPSWNPVNLPNCCAIPKFFFQCQDYTSVLRYVGPGAGLTPNDLKMALYKHKGDVIFVGDSLMRQWFSHLACYLGAWNSWRGYQPNPDNFEREILDLLKKFQPRWKRPDLGRYGVQSSFSHFDISAEKRFINQSTNDISDDEIIDLIFFYNRVYPREYKRNGQPLFILNAGVHFNDKTTPQSLRNTLQLMYDACLKGDMRCIFRETTPQHFQNPNGDGLYTNDTSWNERECMQPPKSFKELDGWRNDVLRSVVSTKSKSSISTKRKKGFVTIMPLFDKLAFLSFAHRDNGRKKGEGNKDCTHFNGHPEYWEPWHVSLTQVLDNIYKRVYTS